MKAFRLAMVAVVVLVAACNNDKTASVPQPLEPGPDAVGTICRMALSEHGGPKGQVFLGKGDKPLWFSSVRDTFTWLLIEDGGQAHAAVWVNDMGKSKGWEHPDAGAWVQARDAFFVAGSNKAADMGGSELVPFADRGKAVDFANAHGGSVLAFSQITREVLSGVAVTHGNHHHE